MIETLYQYCYKDEKLYEYSLRIKEFSKTNNAYLCNYERNPSVDIYISGYEINEIQYNSFDDSYFVYTEFKDVEMAKRAIGSKIKKDKWDVLHNLQKKIHDTTKEYDKKMEILRISEVKSFCEENERDEI